MAIEAEAPLLRSLLPLLLRCRRGARRDLQSSKTVLHAMVIEKKQDSRMLQIFSQTLLILYLASKHL